MPPCSVFMMIPSTPEAEDSVHSTMTAPAAEAASPKPEDAHHAHHAHPAAEEKEEENDEHTDDFFIQSLLPLLTPEQPTKRRKTRKSKSKSKSKCKPKKSKSVPIIQTTPSKAPSTSPKSSSPKTTVQASTATTWLEDIVLFPSTSHTKLRTPPPIPPPPAAAVISLSSDATIERPLFVQRTLSAPPSMTSSASLSGEDTGSPHQPELVYRTTIVTPETRKCAALDAAQVGQLTRLQEHVVEAVSLDPALWDTEDVFYLKSGLQAHTVRSTMFQCINEAAAMGSMKLKWTSRTGNNPYAHYELKGTTDPTQLVDVYVHNEQFRKRYELWDAEKVISQMERHTQLGEEWKTGEVELPTVAVPRFIRPVCYMTDGRLRQITLQEAATQGEKRWQRLEAQPNLKVHTRCRCVYCKRPSAYQTQSYQKLRMRQGWSDDSLEAELGSSSLNFNFDGVLDTPTSSGSGSGAGGRKSNPPFSPSRCWKVSPQKRHTLASITIAPDRRKSDYDPHIPAMFKATTTSKHHVKAWKSRAAKARRELYATAATTSPSSSMPASPDGTTAVATAATASQSTLLSPLPCQAWGSPVHRQKSLLKQLATTGGSSAAAALSSPGDDAYTQSPSFSPPNHHTTNWDATFLSPTQKRKVLSVSSSESKKPPLWATAKLKRPSNPATTLKDPKTRLDELRASQHAPVWAAAKDMLCPLSSEKGKKKKKDMLTMTEHSPMRRHLIGKPPHSPRRSNGMGFLDEEVDEEELLRQELSYFSLESPRRVTIKAPLIALDLQEKEPPSEGDVNQDDYDAAISDYDASCDEDDDDFAY